MTCAPVPADDVLGAMESENLIYEAPITPGNLRATAVTADSVSLEWTSSSWWYETAGHNVLVNGKLAAFEPGKSTTLTGLAPDTQYRIAVVTKDVLGNLSDRSFPVVVTTPPATFSLSLTGKSTLRKGGTVALAGSLDGKRGVTGTSVALALDPATAKLRLFGLIPATGTLTFTPGPVTPGDRVTVETGVKLTGVTIAGVPVSTGPSCTTAVKADLVPGPDFTLPGGGPLTGTYTLPPFTGCGPLTDFLNSSVAGPGNTLELIAQNR
ncbi:fibronectin type III domain-containing protein [Actinokineospora soli]|uniref:Fibronectin type III domain-containing protein n=1 Tax=Actinokineospora soli TaxID=1048753 RepID=A0ABW2TLV1_9PSEU